MIQKKIIPALIVKQMLSSGVTIEDTYVEGVLDLSDLGRDIKHSIIFINCIVEDLRAETLNFEGTVRLINTYFDNCSFMSTYFQEGLLIEGCTFQNNLSFEAGGHNKKPVILKGNKFLELVDFFDAWFQDELLVIGNHFHKGSTLMSNRDKAYGTGFDKEPLCLNNIGRLDIKDEEIE